MEFAQEGFVTNRATPSSAWKYFNLVYVVVGKKGVFRKK